MTIVINGLEIKDVPIKAKEIEFDKDGKDTVYVDNKGKKVVKHKVQSSIFKWTYEDGKDFNGERTYKAVNGKPVKELGKRTVVDKYDKINTDDVAYFINNEHTYLMVNAEFKKQMKVLAEKNKAISFKHVVARGFKVYKAVVVYDQTLDKVFMRCFRGNLKETDLNDDEKGSKKEITADGVDQLSLDEIEV